MKNKKVLEGIMGIVEKVSNIATTVMSKIKNKKELHMTPNQERVLGEVMGTINQQLEELERSIEAIGQENKVIDLYREDTELLNDEIAAAYAECEDGLHIEEVVKAEAVQLEEVQNQELQQEFTEKQEDKRRRIQIDQIPSVVKFDKQSAIRQNEDKMLSHMEKMSKNKGSIHPLHRSEEHSEKRGNTHQRAPTWNKWKEM